MKNTFLKTAGLCFCITALAACGAPSADPPAAESSAASSSSDEEEQEAAASLVSEPVTPVSVPEEEEEIPEPVFLDYIDAWQERHTMEVDPTVAETKYDRAGFVRDEANAQWVTYSDPGYRVLQGIDVSYYQGEIDWNAVADAGYAFAFIRLGYRGYGETGSLNEDDMAVQNLQGAKAAGLKVGGYFFSQALSEEEAGEEAGLALQIVNKAGVPLDLPLIYDPEIIKDEWGRANDITRDQVALNTEAFRQVVESKSDFAADIYSNLPWEDTLFDAKTLNRYDIWYADYEARPQTPYHFTWWQYSNKGQVPGIAGDVDLNLWIIPQ